MTIGGKNYTEAKNAGEAILEACKEVRSDKDLALGEYRGFSMTLEYNACSLISFTIS